MSSSQSWSSHGSVLPILLRVRSKPTQLESAQVTAHKHRWLQSCWQHSERTRALDVVVSVAPYGIGMEHAAYCLRVASLVVFVASHSRTAELPPIGGPITCKLAALHAQVSSGVSLEHSRGRNTSQAGRLHALAIVMRLSPFVCTDQSKSTYGRQQTRSLVAYEVPACCLPLSYEQ